MATHRLNLALLWGKELQSEQLLASGGAKLGVHSLVVPQGRKRHFVSCYSECEQQRVHGTAQRSLRLNQPAAGRQRACKGHHTAQHERAASHGQQKQLLLQCGRFLQP